MTQQCKELILTTEVLLGSSVVYMHSITVKYISTSMIFNLSADDRYIVKVYLSNSTGHFVDDSHVDISTFDIQHADLVQPPLTKPAAAICLQLHFAPGSKANAFVNCTLLDIELPQYYNKSFEQNKTKGTANDCVSVSPHGGIYDVTVYDMQDEVLSVKPAQLLENITVAPTLPPVSLTSELIL